MLRSLDITTWSTQTLSVYKEMLEKEVKRLRENQDFEALQNLDGEYENVVSILQERREDI